MKTHIFLVRHGKSEAAERGIVQGRGIEIPLTEEGKAQAERVAELLKTERFDHIYASTTRRSIETAFAIRQYHPKTPYEEIAELGERSKGLLEGTPKHETALRFPELQAAWDREEDARPPEGENFEDVHARVIPILESHVRFHGPDKTLLYVIHGNVNRVILGYMLNVSFCHQPRIQQDYCAVNIALFDHTKGRWSVECVNRIP